MNDKTKILLALQQIENIAKLVQGNGYEGFFSSHLLPIKYEIIRQINCINGSKQKM